MERAAPPRVSPSNLVNTTPEKSSRKKRIAKGSGKDVSEVNAFMKQFDQMRDMMKQMNKMPMGKMLPGMMGKR